MVVYMLEQRWEVLRHYFENHGNVEECGRKLHTYYGRREAPSASYVPYLVQKKKWNELSFSSINQSVRSQKKGAYTRKYCCCGRKFVWSAININLPSFQKIDTFQGHYWDEFCIKTLIILPTMSNCLRSWTQLTIQCDRLTGDADFDKKKSSFQMKLILILAGM